MKAESISAEFFKFKLKVSPKDWTMTNLEFVKVVCVLSNIKHYKDNTDLEFAGKLSFHDNLMYIICSLEL